MPLARYVLLVTLSLAIAAYALLVYTLTPLGAQLHPEMRVNFEAHRAGIYTHIFASLIALAIGPFQFSTRLRSSRPALHRWLGRIYLGIGVLIGGSAGLFMAFHAFGGAGTRLGFALLALVWLYTGLRAYLAIRRGDVAAHRRWMIRNFALTFAAVTLRLWLPGSFVAGIAFERAYPVIAWLCWVPNLLVAEWLVRDRQRAP